MDERMQDPSSLDFDKAQFEHDDEQGGLACGYCQRAIEDAYFEVNSQTACRTCRNEIEFSRNAGSPVGRFMKAVLYGGIGGAIGAAIYYGVLAATGYEVGLVAIVVGLLVGVGVRIGSGGSGGRVYQVLAVVMTYVSIVSTYVPFIIEAMMSEEAQVVEGVEMDGAGAGAGVAASELPESVEYPSSAETAPDASADPTMAEAMSEGGAVVYVVAIVLVGLIALAAPFLAGVENLIGILIIGFALYEAWRVNAYEPLAIEGPFRLET